MPTAWNRVMSVLLTAALTACATTSAPEHQSQTDPNTNIAAFNSFGWKAAEGGGAGDEPMRMLDVNIRNGIVAELTRRGYTQTDSNPQLLVTYEIAAADKVKSNPVRFGIGIGSFGSSGGGSVSMGSPSVQSYREGKLVVHAIDAAANKEVWYGTVSGRVDKTKLDAEAVARVVAIAMQDFPSRAATAP